MGLLLLPGLAIAPPHASIFLARTVSRRTAVEY